MIIYPSEIEIIDASCILRTPFEIKGEKKDIWYKVPIEYKDYLVTENQDSALVALLTLAMMNGEDIHVKGQISSRLHYTINTYLIKALNLSNKNFKLIKVVAEKLNSQPLARNIAATTGISCGIDSLSTIATHSNLNDEHNIKYLTYFKAGSHGVYGGKLSNKIFDRGLENAKQFAKENKFPLIVVDTNLGELLKVSFQKLHSILQLSCVLILQKLINRYYYSSAYRFDYFKISKLDTSSWDILILSLLGTESTSFFSSMSQLTRFERTEVVANYEPSYKYLDVCLDPIHASVLNCSKCEKCLRTLISLELIGKIDYYKDVFDLPTYYNKKDQYIGALLINKNLNQINQEIYYKLRQRDFIKTKHYGIAVYLTIGKSVKNFKSLIKALFKL